MSLHQKWMRSKLVTVITLGNEQGTVKEKNMARTELFIGITSWNSARFLALCFDGIKRTTQNINTEVVVFDNCSEDESVEVAIANGARVVRDAKNQGDALNILLNQSDAEHTLLIHSDVVLLSTTWFQCCLRHFKENSDLALISPEDIGCGLMSRSFGAGHPESSFMLFKTEAVKAMRQWKVVRRRFLIPRKLGNRFDFYGKHVTHNISALLKKHNKTWIKMKPLYSNMLNEPRYKTDVEGASLWSSSLAYLEYGLGNFYSLGGQITHYHNWYERADRYEKLPNMLTTEPNNGGYPLDYIKQYTEQFMSDYLGNSINLPTVDQLPANNVLESFGMQQ